MKKIIREKLVREIQREHLAFEGGLRGSLEHAKHAGERLTAVKEGMAHGTFMAWVKATFTFSHATANLYMRIAREWDHIVANSELVANMSIGVLDRWLRHGSRSRAANRPLIEKTWTVLGYEERVGKDFEAFLRKLETVMAMTDRIHSVILVLTEPQSQTTMTTLLTLRRHVDDAIAAVKGNFVHDDEAKISATT